MIKIGIISDTHNHFCPKVKKFLEDCDEIWHCGDIGSIECADEIAKFKPLIAVQGNIDNNTTRLEYPKYKGFEREGMRVLMTHIGGYPSHYDKDAEIKIRQFRPHIFLSGHSHILKVINDKRYNLIHINPGACGNHGFHRVRTAIRMTIDNGKITDLEVSEWQR